MPEMARPSLTVAVIHHQLRDTRSVAWKPSCRNSPMETRSSSSPARLPTLPVAKAVFPRVQVVLVERGDRAEAKNLAISRARGDLLLLVAADMVVQGGAIESIAQVF